MSLGILSDTSKWEDDKWIGWDKLAHIGVGFVITVIIFILGLYMMNLEKIGCSIFSFFMFTIAALVKDFGIDSKPSYKDIIATELGGIVGVVVFYFI